jgi:hypothetical protein
MGLLDRIKRAFGFKPKFDPISSFLVAIAKRDIELYGDRTVADALLRRDANR